MLDQSFPVRVSSQPSSSRQDLAYNSNMILYEFRMDFNCNLKYSLYFLLKRPLNYLPIAMDDCIECKAIPPRMGEIVNTNIWIPMSSFLGPAK